MMQVQQWCNPYQPVFACSVFKTLDTTGPAYTAGTPGSVSACGDEVNAAVSLSEVRKLAFTGCRKVA